MAPAEPVGYRLRVVRRGERTFLLYMARGEDVPRVAEALSNAEHDAVRAALARAAPTLTDAERRLRVEGAQCAVYARLLRLEEAVERAAAQGGHF